MPTIMIILLPFIFLSNGSLLFLWVILEMSSIMFICMCLSEEEEKKKEPFLMYFLIQSFASSFLLISLFSSMLMMKTMALENSNNMSLTIIFLIALKIAMGPMHFWLVKMAKLISWISMGTLLTWQKIIPLSFLSSFSMNLFMASICVFSLLIGTLSQMKLTSLKMLIVFSSIAHLGWMVYPLTKSSMLLMSYLFIYSLIMIPLMGLMFFSNYKYLFNQMEYKMLTNLFLLIISLSGIPPLMGFLLKWLSMTCMMPSISAMMLFSLMACLSFYIYIRMTYKSFLLTPFSMKQNSPMMTSQWIWSMNFFLPIIPILI